MKLTKAEYTRLKKIGRVSKGEAKAKLAEIFNALKEFYWSLEGEFSQEDDRKIYSAIRDMGRMDLDYLKDQEPWEYQMEKDGPVDNV